ncbi:MAG TPA: energy-coupling factor transporter transmembrane protein EcfT [Clostridiaceae bacterium]|jgi:energy-coupling factor transport system permease protein|nr:energy-coupling factor transporter transmembrane protein EcfT [Clostridiaceae bacterium]HOA30357.1 energy-coupling factor transporter transmembrane component T [Clostridia bacterium]
MKSRLDPRITMLFIVLTSTLSVLASNVYWLLLVFLLTLLLNIVFRLNPLKTLYRMRRLVSMIIFIAFFQSLTTSGGRPIITLLGANIVTSKGLVDSLSFVLRMGNIMLAVMLGTKHDSRDMIDGLAKLKIPYELAFMTGIALKFIPLFGQEFADRIKAVSLRGINIKKLKLSKKIKIYSHILVPAISGSIIKSRDIASSMETRGFRAYPDRTNLRVLKLKLADYIAMIIASSIFLLIIYFMFARR